MFITFTEEDSQLIAPIAEAYGQQFESFPRDQKLKLLIVITQTLRLREQLPKSYIGMINVFDNLLPASYFHSRSEEPFAPFFRWVIIQLDALSNQGILVLSETLIKQLQYQSN
jgi:hypothetical protein